MEIWTLFSRHCCGVCFRLVPRLTVHGADPENHATNRRSRHRSALQSSLALGLACSCSHLSDLILQYEGQAPKNTPNVAHTVKKKKKADVAFVTLVSLVMIIMCCIVVAWMDWGQIWAAGFELPLVLSGCTNYAVSFDSQREPHIFIGLSSVKCKRICPDRKVRVASWCSTDSPFSKSP